ncbi:hypothetical protein EMCG_05094 [[Emmonsia] crescens]|uniref:Uncharacterized protein n=1 Tax=[Emmonsia] crescens TaxID=73230 RepID=A0A0G2HQ03_9EURO|nr:hypothetical protein EMCG_05094 [Emmonsia crescens UAMH 3008]
MAPPTKKRKLDPTHDLGDVPAQLQAVLSDTSIQLPSSVISLLTSIQTWISAGTSEDVTVLDYQASKLSLQEARDLTGVDFVPTRPEYCLSLKEIPSPLAKSLSNWAARILGAKPCLIFYFATVWNTASRKRLHVVSEANLEFSTTIGSIKKKVSGRCDWALGYMDDRSKLQELLVQTESPGNIGAALPQLLTYLASVHAARSAANKTNNVVFGLITDSIHFRFAVLRGNKRLFLSNYLCWWNEKAVIVAFLHHVLRDAILHPMLLLPDLATGGLEDSMNHSPRHTISVTMLTMATRTRATCGK